MKVTVDDRSGVPIYNQIVEQVKRAIATGILVPGDRLPTIRKLAVELNVHVNTVAHAYAELEHAGVVATRPGLGTFIMQHGDDSRLLAEREARLMGITARMITEALSLGYSLDQIEAALALRLAQWRTAIDSGQRYERVSVSPSNTLVIAGSHDITLDMVVGRLKNRVPGVDVSSANVGSLAGLIALAKGEAHVAGCHLLDEETGEYNLPFVKRFLPGQGAVLINLAYRLQGFIIQKGNPHQITGIKDLARDDIVFVNRQPGSGTRVLLDYKLRDAGIESGRITGYEREESTHVAVAAAVASGAADVGLGILPAARALELDFIPLWRERYDLVVTRHNYDSPLLRPLLETIRDQSFHLVVDQMGGYETKETGQIIGETH